MGAMAAFTISTNVSASKTKIADVSQYQGTINWSKASKQLKFAIIRVQHGDTGDADFRIDTHKDINANGAYKYNVPFGQYGYAEFSSVADAKKKRPKTSTSGLMPKQGSTFWITSIVRVRVLSNLTSMLG